jgi:hypothetical protein
MIEWRSLLSCSICIRLAKRLFTAFSILEFEIKIMNFIFFKKGLGFKNRLKFWTKMIKNYSKGFCLFTR